jgi:hypothetical protein
MTIAHRTVPRLCRALGALALVTAFAAHALDAQSSAPVATQRVPRDGATVVRLELPGAVEVRVAEEDWIEVAASSWVRGFTIGSSNADARPPHRTEASRRADTLIVRPAPRAPLRAVGISWRSERFEHVVVVPRSATVVIDGASTLRLEGRAAPRCAQGAWRVGPDATISCVAVTAW